MDAWVTGLIVLAGVAVVVTLTIVAELRGFRRGRAEGLRKGSQNDNSHSSLFGLDIPVMPTEQKFIETMPGAVIVCEGGGSVVYTSPAARSRDLVSHERLAAHELEDILARVVADGKVREREVSIAVSNKSGDGTLVAGRGVQPGGSLPTNTMYLRVRVGMIADDLYAIFVADVSEQRRFEAMRRDFVTNVSHELKTPAGAISLLAETITDAADDPKAVRYFSGRISMESQRLTELVHHLIDLQRAQSPQAILNADRLSVLGIVQDAVAANVVQAENKHIDIHVSLGGRLVARTSQGDGDLKQPDDVFIMADREAMTTAVKNLVQNAVKYSPERTTIGVGIIQQHDKVMVRVVDQGIGIPPQSLGRIFERFYRVDPARSRHTGGSGLGLAITKHCVQDCGGTISVWSRQGEGSTFTIEMPAAPPQSPSAQATADAAAPAVVPAAGDMHTAQMLGSNAA